MCIGFISLAVTADRFVVNYSLADYQMLVSPISMLMSETGRISVGITSLASMEDLYTRICIAAGLGGRRVGNMSLAGNTGIRSLVVIRSGCDSITNKCAILANIGVTCVCIGLLARIITLEVFVRPIV